MTNLSNSPEKSDSNLKSDLDRLFSAEFANIQEESERTIFLGAKTVKRVYNLKSQPDEALTAVYEGLKSKNGYLRASFYRYQTAISLFGIERITEDRVTLIVDDFSYSGGTWHDVPYEHTVDMRLPATDYDERLAAVVRTYLSQSTE